MKNKITTEKFHKELDLIQGCITRMADNSFRLKEWYVSLISIALTVLISQKSELEVIGIFLMGVTTVFWGLDAFFLKMETLYRWKYEWVIEKRLQGEISYLFDLNPHNSDMWIDAKKKNTCMTKYVFSKTLLPLYGTIEFIAIIIWVTILKVH